MALTATLRERLAAFDGRATTLLGEAEAALQAEPDYIDALIALVPDGQAFVGSGASWLTKSWLERGGALSAAQTAALITTLPHQQAHWSTHLHLAQSIRFLDLTAAQAAACHTWLTPLVSHTRPFVRAWALDALAHIARHHADHRAAFEAALRAVQQDPAASVRARARRLTPAD